MIDLSSLIRGQYYLITSTRPAHCTKPLTADIAFIFKHLSINIIGRENGEHINGYVEGQREDIDLGRILGFHLLDLDHYHDTHYVPRQKFFILASVIKDIRPLEKRDGPLVINWHNLSADVTTFLFK